jgi:TP901 family phage tail tape measure protein
VATPLALVFDLIARDGASPVFNRVAVSADRAAVATGRAEKSVVGIGGKMKAAFAGLAIGAVAVEAVKAASQFQKSMLAIQTQAGASAKEVKTFSSALLTLGPKVATGPEALSVSMYHVYSALKKVGADGPQMLNAVKIAAEGAKVGNTDLEDTTNSLTATLASGIVKFNEAGKAMGYLNAIVGAGDMKFSDLNQALGTGLLVTMKTFGVSLNDTGAALAVFGDNNIRGADAATKLRMSVQDLAKPAAHAAGYLAQIHLTVDQLRATLTEHGLNDALHLLKSHLDEAGISGSKVGAFLEDAFTKKAGAGLAVLLTRMDQFDEARKTEQKGANSFGAAWVATTKTASYQFDKIKAQVEAFGIALGTKLLPYVTEAAQWLGTNLPKAFALIGQILAPLARLVGDVLLGAFRALVPVVKAAWDVLAGVGHFLASNSSAVKNFAVAVGVLWAAWKGFTILKIALGLIGSIPALVARAASAMVGLNLGVQKFVGGWANFGVVAGTVTGAFALIMAGMNAYESQQSRIAAENAAYQADIESLTAAIKLDTGALGDNTRAFVEHRLQKEGLYNLANKIGVSYKTMTQAALGSVPAIREVTRAADANKTGIFAQKLALAALNDQVGKARHAYSQMTSAEREFNVDATVTGRTVSGLASTFRDQVPAYAAVKNVTIGTADATTKLKTATQLLKGALAAVMGLLNRAADAIAFQQSLNDLTATFKQNKNAIDGHKDAALADRSAFISVGQQIVQNAQAMRDHGATVQRVTGYLRTHIDALKDAAVKAGADKTQVDNLSTSLGLVPKTIVSKINVDTTEALAKLATFESEMRTAASMGLGSTLASQVPRYRVPGRATGGGLPDGWSAVGEQGAELVHKSGGKAHVFSNQQSRAIVRATGMRVPGFARGTRGAVSSLMSVIRQAGFSGSAADVMYGIVEAESGGNRFAHNTNSSTGDNSYGLAQINMIGSMGPARRAQFHLASNNALFDPLTNLRVAYSLSSHGRNFSPWTTFTSGAYRQFLSGPENAKVRASGSGAGALSAARTRAANIRSNSLSRIDSLLGGIGSAANGPQIDVGSTGIRLVERQIRAARNALVNLPGLKGPELARYNAKINELVRQAQRQFDKLKLHIKKVDIGDLTKALKGAAADVRAAFGSLITDLRHLGAPHGVIARLQRQEARLLPMIRQRNREQAHLDSLKAADKSLQNTVKSAATGFFDVTSAGTSPVTGQVNAGSMIAQQKQDLIKIRKFGADLTKLGRRGLNHAYLRQLASAGPSVLPQLEALLQMSASQFAGFNRREGRIEAAGAAAGRHVGHDIYGARERAARAEVRLSNKDIHTLAKAIREGARDGASEAHIHLDPKYTLRELERARRKNNDLHGASS